MNDIVERNKFESRLIATLAACSVCQPTEEWLGSNSYSAVVRAAGMWNSEFVGTSVLTDPELARFRDLVRRTSGFHVAEDLSDTLLLIPCSAGKRGVADPGLSPRRLVEFLGEDASNILTEGRELAFARRGVTLEADSEVRSAISYYSGQPYKNKEFRESLLQGLERGLHCLIISGGYGLLLPEEPINRYGAHLPTQTASVWRKRIPLILRDYVQRHGITRTIGVFSSGYANVVPDDLTGDDCREVPRIEAQDTGSAQTVVPRKVGESLVRILDRVMRGEEP